MRQKDRKKASQVLIVTHGLTVRCFAMRFLHLRVEDFDRMLNPANCDIITIAKNGALREPQFSSGRWGVEGMRLRQDDPEGTAWTGIHELHEKHEEKLNFSCNSCSSCFPVQSVS